MFLSWSAFVTIFVEDFMGLLEVMTLGTALGYDRPKVGFFGSRLRLTGF